MFFKKSYAGAIIFAARTVITVVFDELSCLLLGVTCYFDSCRGKTCKCDIMQFSFFNVFQLFGFWGSFVFAFVVVSDLGTPRAPF